MTDGGKTPETVVETVAEIVEAINPYYLLIAFLSGAAIVAAIVYAIGSKSLPEESEDA